MINYYSEIRLFILVIITLSLLLILYNMPKIIASFINLRKSAIGYFEQPKSFDTSFRGSKYFYLSCIVFSISIVSLEVIQDYARNDMIRVLSKGAGSIEIRIDDKSLNKKEKIIFINDSLAISRYVWNDNGDARLSQKKVSIFFGQNKRTYFYAQDSIYKNRYSVRLESNDAASLGFVETSVLR